MFGVADLLFTGSLILDSLLTFVFTLVRMLICLFWFVVACLLFDFYRFTVV